MSLLLCVAVYLRIVSSLARLGVTPNIRVTVQSYMTSYAIALAAGTAHMYTANHTAHDSDIKEEEMSRARGHRLLLLLLTLFHPIAVGVTCMHPLDLTRPDQYGFTLFQHIQEVEQLDADADEEERTGPSTITPAQLRQIIIRVNRQQQEQQRRRIATFLLATHHRIGAPSPLFRVLCASPLYDRHILSHICSYIDTSSALPASQAELDEIKQQQQHRSRA